METNLPPTLEAQTPLAAPPRTESRSSSDLVLAEVSAGTPLGRMIGTWEQVLRYLNIELNCRCGTRLLLVHRGIALAG